MSAAAPEHLELRASSFPAAPLPCTGGGTRVQVGPEDCLAKTLCSGRPGVYRAEFGDGKGQRSHRETARAWAGGQRPLFVFYFVFEPPYA